MASRQARPTRAPWLAQAAPGAVDANGGQIVAVTLTNQDGDDASQIDALLEQIPGAIEQVTAGGAYDGAPTYEAIPARSADIEVVIPPRASSTPPLDLGTNASRRDVHVHTVSALGRLRLAGGNWLRPARAGRDDDGSLKGAHRDAAASA